MSKTMLNLNGASAEPVSEAKTAPKPVSRLNSAILVVFVGVAAVILYLYGLQIAAALGMTAH